MEGLGWAVWLVLGLAAGAAALSWRRRWLRLPPRPGDELARAGQGERCDPFVGRGRLEDRLLQTLANNSLLLLGEPRIGKTALLRHLRHRMLAEELPRVCFFPVLVDLDGVSEERFFSHLRLAVLSQVRPAAGDEAAVLPSRCQQPYGARQLAHDLQLVLRALARRTTKQVRLVLLIDRADLLNDFNPRVNQQLRSLFMRSFGANLAAVLAGVEVRRNWEREGSPWYNFLEEVEMGPLEPDDARQLAQQLLRGRVGAQRSAVDRLVQLSGGRPERLRHLVSRLRERHQRPGPVTAGDVDAAAAGLGLSRDRPR